MDNHTKTSGQVIIEIWEEWWLRKVFIPRERDSKIDPLELVSSSLLLALDLVSDSWASVKQPKLLS